jgi:hypothetical protein
MEINKKQLIDQLRFLAANDNAAFNEVLNAVIGENTTMVEESNPEYISAELQKQLLIEKFRAESFKRFDKVYKALS